MRFEQRAIDDATGQAIGAVSSEQWLETANNCTTGVAPELWGSYRFTHWTVSSNPQDAFRDPWGRAQNPVGFTLYEHTVATARYLPTTLDSNGDGVPDWFKIHYYGTLAVAAGLDSDGDGFTLLQEYQSGSHPLYGNEHQPGGLARGQSALVVVNLAGFARYTLRSEPAGTLSQSETVSPGTVITTPEMAQTTFGYWTLDGVPQRDPWGVALRRISFTVDGADREAVAFMYAGDSDADGLPDAWEQYHFGTLGHGASDDFGGDGRTLLQNYQAGQNPLYGYEHQPGGVARGQSAMVVVNLADFPRYTLRSEPAGTLSQSATVSPGTVITTPEMAQTTFGYWTLDGVPQRDPWGVALRRISFTVDGADREAVAFMYAGDSDADGLPDAWEHYHFGTLGHGASDDFGGDGRTLLQNYQAGQNPLYGYEHQPGGVARGQSAMVVANLQPFERVDFGLVNGILTHFFAIRPGQPGGVDFGMDSSPALGDWDGDGDPDLFVGAAGQPVRVFENIGSAYRFDLGERSIAFGAPDLSGGTLALGDWDGDGLADLAAGFGDGTVRLIKSTGSFSNQVFSVDYVIDTGAPNAVPAFGDATGDGLADLLVLLGDGTIRAYPNSGDPAAPFDASTFVSGWQGIQVPGGSGLAMVDITFDGVPDLLVSDADGRIWEFHADGAGGFALKSKVWGGTYDGFATRLTLAAGDLDGDGDTDAILGFAEGGLTFLRDPRIGSPSYLKAYGGYDSIRLVWDVGRSHRLKGYYLYRATSPTGPFARTGGGLIPVSAYLDTEVVAGATYYYYVTAASATYAPGSSVPQIVESPPSATVAATAGLVRVWMADYFGKAGENAVLQINVEHGSGILGDGMDIRISYDPALLVPLAQAGAGPTVEKTALTQSLVVSDNSASADGELRIAGSGGAVVGNGTLFNVHFRVAAAAQSGRTATNAFTFVALQGAGGGLAVDSSDTACFTVTASGYFFGDVNGDGALDMGDHHHLLWLLRKNTRDPTPQEIAAGDMNGNGELDHRDIPLLLRLIHGR